MLLVNETATQDSNYAMQDSAAQCIYSRNKVV